jgi:hypothetical protein
VGVSVGELGGGRTDPIQRQVNLHFGRAGPVYV